MAKTKIFGEEYLDMEDLKCPKCGCEDFDWDNDGSYPNSEIWDCKCCECGHKFTVIEESFYQIEDEE